jgi:hypothetical protein
MTDGARSGTRFSSGAKARSIFGPCGTTEVVPFPKVHDVTSRVATPPSHAFRGDGSVRLSIRAGGFLEFAELIDLYLAVGEDGFDLQLASHGSNH